MEGRNGERLIRKNILEIKLQSEQGLWLVGFNE